MKFFEEEITELYVSSCVCDEQDCVSTGTCFQFCDD